MNKPPAFQFYAKDWQSSPTISAMTLTQKGLAIHLLSVSWLYEPQGCLPSDPNKISHLSGLHHGTVKRFLKKFPFFFETIDSLLAGSSPHSRHFSAESSPNLRRFLAVFAPNMRRNGELLANAKVLGQAVSYWQLSEKRSEAARKVHASVGHLYEQTGGSAPATAPATAPANTKSKSNPTATPAASPQVDLPIWIPEWTWRAFTEMRSKMRPPLTHQTTILIFKKLKAWMEAGQNPQEILEQSIVNGWRGVFELKGGNRNGTQRGPIDAEEAIRQTIENLGGIN